jgi:hypothetical protein
VSLVLFSAFHIVVGLSEGAQRCIYTGISLWYYFCEGDGIRDVHLLMVRRWCIYEEYIKCIRVLGLHCFPVEDDAVYIFILGYHNLTLKRNLGIIKAASSSLSVHVHLYGCGLDSRLHLNRYQYCVQSLCAVVLAQMHISNQCQCQY